MQKNFKIRIPSEKLRVLSRSVSEPIQKTCISFEFESSFQCESIPAKIDPNRNFQSELSRLNPRNQ